MASSQEPGIEQLSGRHDLHGEGDIRRRERRITGGVVMDGDEGRGLLAHGFAEDLGHPHLGLTKVVLVLAERGIRYRWLTERSPGWIVG
jgi:hypothetical protein